LEVGKVELERRRSSEPFGDCQQGEEQGWQHPYNLGLDHWESGGVKLTDFRGEGEVTGKGKIDSQRRVVQGGRLSF